ncbi:MAG: hypothetical protein KF833_23225 [Verrucomicrobiae bacterium]|nr:hypothetical protein [Verrucomicrobiae bacterium]
MTVPEVLVMITIAGVLALLILPNPFRARDLSRRIQCVNNLKGIGLSFRIFASEHQDRHPMQLASGPANSEATDPFPIGILLSLSNQIRRPASLACPTDLRRPANRWDDLSPRHLSYFFGMDVDEARPHSLLAGDRNLTVGGRPVVSGWHQVTSNSLLGWSDAMHRASGNVGLADGSVQQATAHRLREQVRAMGMVTQWLAIP